MLTEESDITRTSKGDRLLVLCQTDPTHPEVLAWLDAARGLGDPWSGLTDEELVEMTIHIFTLLARSKNGES